MTNLQIVLSLIADSPDEMSVMTVNAQVRWGLELQFFDFAQLKNGKFICWFKVPHSLWVEKVANGKA